MEWRLEFADLCLPFTGGCFRYSLSTLQKQDTDVGLMFYVIMHVYNNAGHFITLKTLDFSLPSAYPPGQVIVTDIDPVDATDSNLIGGAAVDIDAHFTNNTACLSWTGFVHHEDVTLEFGIGSLQGLDDIYNFTHVNNSGLQCITSSNIPSGMRIFTSLRAMSTGGSTISSSDGLIIYNVNSVMNELVVFDGPECFKENNDLTKTTSSLDETLILEQPLAIGKTYSLRILSQNIPDAYTNASALGIHMKQIINDSKHTDLIFRPFHEIQNLPLPTALNWSDSNITAQLYACEEDVTAVKSKGFLEGHWHGLSNHFTYETAVITLRCLDTSDEACYEYQTPFSAVNGNTALISNLTLLPESTYYVGVRPCLNGNCLRTKLSSGVYIEPDEVIINIRKSEMSSTAECTNVIIEWDKLSNLNVSFYQWSVTAGIGKTKSPSTIERWHTVDMSDEPYLQVRFFLARGSRAIFLVRVCSSYWCRR